MINIKRVIFEYIQLRWPWFILNLLDDPNIEEGIILFTKETSSSEYDEYIKVSKILTEDELKSVLNEVLFKIGSSIPIIFINYDSIQIMNKRIITLDVANPQFFTFLDMILFHLFIYDDLLTFVFSSSIIDNFGESPPASFIDC